jgi:hypothetical protein
MNTNLKKALLIFGGGFILFWAFKKIKPVGSVKSKKSSKSSEKIVSDSDKKNAVVVLNAYRAAQGAGEPKSFLDEMNLEFSKEYSMKVYTDKGSGKLFVADLEGNKIL